jgi:hypothetical protein
MDKEFINIGDWQIDVKTGRLEHIPCNITCTAWVSNRNKGMHIRCPEGEKNIKIPTMVIDIIRGYLK